MTAQQQKGSSAADRKMEPVCDVLVFPHKLVQEKMYIFNDSPAILRIFWRVSLLQECLDLLFTKWYELEMNVIWQNLYSFLLCTGCFPFSSCILLHFKYSQCLEISCSLLKMIQSSECSWGVFTFLSALIGLWKALFPQGWQGAVIKFDLKRSGLESQLYHKLAL